MSRNLLERTLQHLNSQHLSKVCERYSLPSQPLHEKTLRDALLKALQNPQAFEDLQGTLTPFEHQMLWYIKLKGGTVNGWELVAHALCISDGPPEFTPIHLFTTGLRDIEANSYLYLLFQDLLIVPIDQQSSWLKGKRAGTDDFRVQADRRILDLLVPPPAAVPLTYQVPTVPHAAPTRHPVHLLIQLALLWRHMLHEGPIKITQQGQYPKTFLQGLERHLHLTSNQVEVLLNTMLHLGVLRVEDHQVRAVLDRFKVQLRRPLKEQFLDVVTGYLKLYGGDVRLVPYTWIIMRALSLLPGPVDLSIGLKTLEEGFLGAFLVSDNGRNHFEHPMQAHQITDTHWSHLELLGILEVNWEQNLLMPTEGLNWLESLTQVPDRSGPESVAPCMVIQTNFEVMVYLSMLAPEHLQVLLLMHITHMDPQTLTAEINKTSFLQGMEVLGSFEDALALLQQASLTPIASNVLGTLYGWAKRKAGNVLRSNVTLLEFPTREERDQHHETVGGYAEKVGQTRLLVKDQRRLPREWKSLDYQQPLSQHAMVIAENGEVQVRGTRDLITQALVERYLQETPTGTYQFKPDALRSGSLTPTQRKRFEHRLGGRLPGYVMALIDIHAGLTQPPICEEVMVFRHPRAQQLAEHPRLRVYLQEALAPTTYLISKEHQLGLQEALQELGLPPLSPQDLPASRLSTHLPMRELRNLLQEAIEHQRVVDLLHQVEPQNQGQPEAALRELLQPVELYQLQQQWHVVVRNLDGNAEHTIALKHIQGIKVS